MNEKRLIAVVVIVAFFLCGTLSLSIVCRSKMKAAARAKDIAVLADTLGRSIAKSNDLVARREFERATAALGELKPKITTMHAANLEEQLQRAMWDIGEAKRDYKAKLNQGYSIFEAQFISKEEKDRILAERERGQAAERERVAAAARARAEREAARKGAAKEQAKAEVGERKRRQQAEARTEAIYVGRGVAKRALKSPTSATFPVARDPSYHVSRLSKQVFETEFFRSADYEVQDGYEVSGWVTAKNAFGVELRQPWFVQFVYLEDDAGTVLPLYIEINGEAAFGKKDVWK